MTISNRYEDGAICSNMGQFGHGKKTRSGGCSEYTTVPARYLYVIKSDLGTCFKMFKFNTLIFYFCSIYRFVALPSS